MTINYGLAPHTLLSDSASPLPSVDGLLWKRIQRATAVFSTECWLYSSPIPHPWRAITVTYFLLNVVSFLFSHSTPLGRAYRGNHGIFYWMLYPFFSPIPYPWAVHTLRYFLLEVTSLLLPFHDLVGQSRYFLLHVISFLLSHSTQSGHYDWLFLTFLSCQLIWVVWWGSSRDWRSGLTLRSVKQFSSLVLPVGVCVVTNIPEVVAAGNGG